MVDAFRKARALLVVAALAAMLSGCGAAKLSDLDREFVSLYQSKAEHGDLFLPAESLTPSFADLSDRAAAGAKAAPADALPLRVAYWRVATLAAWQAGEQGEAVVIERATSGSQACAALRAANQDAPRDCLLIEIAEPLARQDATLRDMQALVQRLGAGTTYPASERPRFVAFFNDFVARLQDLGTVRRREFGRAPVPDAFWPRFDRQMAIVACNANKAHEYVLRTGASMDELGGLFNRLKEAAEATAVAEPSVLYSAATCLDLTNAPSGLGDGGR